jgi:hypothetical protein
MITRRGKATLLSVLAFGTALVIYLVATRPDSKPAQTTQLPETSGAPSADSPRSLGRKLGSLLKPDPAPQPPGNVPTHSAGPICDKCTTDNCNPGTDDGCDSITDAADRAACEDAYECFTTNHCMVDGDPIPCWCGTNMGTCVTDNAGPTRANGPCVKQVFAAAKTTDADTIFRQLLNADLPIGRAARLTLCRGSHCLNDCKIR